ncbi:MAG: hypothetical protein QG559_704 [Campylobacterota bacterium]|nr:hypothetical protein [Campylobacterota bacterium]
MKKIALLGYLSHIATLNRFKITFYPLQRVKIV